METNNESNNVRNSEKRLDKRKELVHEKEKLKQQIQRLKAVTLQMEYNLDLSTFKKVKTASDLNMSNVTTDRDISEVPDVNVELESQLFRYAGFQCIQFSHQEFIFNFSALNRYNKENIYAIQILNKETEWCLGKWIMPMSVDLDNLAPQFSKGLKGVPPFVKTCKQYIDCYTVRHDQFNTLKEAVSHINNCTLQTNDGHSLIILDVIGVHNIETDSDINIIIYLHYNIDEVRPCKIIVDSQHENKLNKKVTKQLEHSLKCFKMFDLCTAFEDMLNDSFFTWAQVADEDSPLNINNLSNSDEEGFLEDFTFQEKSLSSSRKRRKKRKTPKQRGTHGSNISKRIRKDEESTSFQNKEGTSFSQHSVKLKKKLKQTKLKFRLYNRSSSYTTSNTEQLKDVTPENAIANRKVDQVITSTPLHQNQNRSMGVTKNNVDDISDIVNEESLQRP